MPLRSYGPLLGHTYGSDVPVVVGLHGWARRGSDFDQVFVGLDAVAFDLPGFGATPPPDHRIGTPGYAEALEAALESIGAGPYVILGHSFGGRVAVHVAARRPDLVKSLILTGVPLIRRRNASRPSLGYKLVRFGNRIGVVGEARMERIRRARGSADYRAAQGVMREIFVTVVNESYESELSAIEAPVDLVWGADETEVPLVVAEAARDVVVSSGGTCRLTVLDGVGHMTPVQASTALRAFVDEHLARTES
jgi:pimeloyl-ACP methyl ester carboxylesterase